MKRDSPGMNCEEANRTWQLSRQGPRRPVSGGEMTRELKLGWQHP